MRCMAVVLSGLLLLGGSARAWATDPCAHDQAAMLALDEEAFDQDLANGGGGWRAIGNVPGCELAAADLIAAYRNQHPAASALLAWHEGQLRAMAGQYDRAIALLDQDRKPADRDPMGWNRYVDATIAFLRHDKRALVKARKALAGVPYSQASGLPPLKDGYFELPAPPGQVPSRMRWPPNIEVVDGLVACFDKPYSQAYEPGCRPGAASF
jgi:hypothetical protein